jgi:5-methyltetrahydrofolate corrinoid/iron sulfur protein methyltransferase
MFKKVREAIEERDKSAIHELARAQVAAGANALDLNVGPATGDAIANMMWLVETTREVTDAPLWIDSPRWSLQKEVLPRVPGAKGINSTKADEAALEKYLPLVVENNAAIVALTIDQDGVPADVEKRIELGAQIMGKAMEAGLPMENLYIDPIILPVNVAPAQPLNVLKALQQLVVFSDPPPHLVVGLSNLSQNCNHRKMINRTYLVMALASGLDAAIVDPLDEDLMNAVITAELLLGKAIYCDGFLEAHRMRSKAAGA